MGRELGRISGPLLADNLRRNGVDLAFDNQVLYLDVTNSRVGFNTATPVTDLYTPTNIQTTNLIVSDTATIGNWTVSGNTFQYLLNTSIRISPNQASNPKISTPGLSTSKLYVYGNTISTYNSSSNINITPNGTGGINFSNDSGSVDVTVNADIHATGNITWDGDITLGNETTDTITFAAEVSSDILPSQTDTYNLGSDTLKWHNIYANSITANSSIPSEVFATNNYLGNLLITSNNISNTNSSNNIYLTPSGTGLVNFNSVNYIQDSNIYIPTSGDFVLSSTSNGYIKFGGTSGTIFPAGGINQRPLTPEVGQLRYNVDLQSSEVWDGTTWIPLQGTATDTLSANDVADEMWRWDIILG